MKPSCIALDFDFTVAHFIGGLEGLLDIFVRRKAKLPLVDKAEKQAEVLGFCIETFQACVEEMTATKFDSQTVEKDFYGWLKQTLRTYHDSLPTIDSWYTKYPIAIVTFGNPAYQLQKVTMVQVLYHQIHVTSKGQTKVEPIKSLLQKYGPVIFFIDDKVTELDAIRQAGLTTRQVRTIIMRRPDSPYINVPNKLNHEEIKTLEELKI